MTDLLDAVDDLTLPRNIRVQTDTGHTWATEDPLLTQLQEAITSTLSSGSGAGGSAWTRNVLDGDALYRASIITTTIGDWCRMAGAPVTRDPIHDLRAWYVARLSANNPEQFYLDTLKGWAGQIRAMVSPPRTVEILGACPVCDQGTFTNDLGEIIRNPLTLTHPQGTVNGARVLCRACEAVWQGAPAIAELADELEERTA